MATTQRRNAQGRLLTSGGWPSRGRGDEKVVIRYFVIPNPNPERGGFLPLIEENGRLHGVTYGRGYDREHAEALAVQMAHEKASRYTGDWEIRVAPAPAKYIKGAMHREAHRWDKVKK